MQTLYEIVEDLLDEAGYKKNSEEREQVLARFGYALFVHTTTLLAEIDEEREHAEERLKACTRP